MDNNEVTIPEVRRVCQKCDKLFWARIDGWDTCEVCRQIEFADISQIIGNINIVTDCLLGGMI